MKIFNQNQDDILFHLNKLLEDRIEKNSNEIDNIVYNIIEDVRVNGDDALIKYTKKFDNNLINKSQILISNEIKKNKKIKINNIDKTNSYDIAKLNLIEDNDTVIEEQLKRKKLINKFISLIASSNENINLNIMDTSMISTEMLTNLGSLILPLENEDKQKLLELNDIELRLEVLCQFLDSELKVESDLINFNQIIPTNINWN